MATDSHTPTHANGSTVGAGDIDRELVDAEETIEDLDI